MLLIARRLHSGSRSVKQNLFRLVRSSTIRPVIYGFKRHLVIRVCDDSVSKSRAGFEPRETNVAIGGVLEE